MVINMININNGEIKFNKFILKPYMKLNLLTSCLQDKDIVSIDKTERINIYLSPQKAGENYFVIRLFFEKGRLELTDLIVSIQDNDLIPSWKDWSEERELKRKYANDMWLKKELGSLPYDFCWGRIKSVYNSKEGSSYVMIIYT